MPRMANDRLAMLAIAMGAILYVLLIFLNMDKWFVSLSHTGTDPAERRATGSSETGYKFSFKSYNPYSHIKTKPAHVNSREGKDGEPTATGESSKADSEMPDTLPMSKDKTEQINSNTEHRPVFQPSPKKDELQAERVVETDTLTVEETAVDKGGPASVPGSGSSSSGEAVPVLTEPVSSQISEEPIEVTSSKTEAAFPQEGVSIPCEQTGPLYPPLLVSSETPDKPVEGTLSKTEAASSGDGVLVPSAPPRNGDSISSIQTNPSDPPMPVPSQVPEEPVEVTVSKTDAVSPREDIAVASSGLPNEMAVVKQSTKEPNTLEALSGELSSPQVSKDNGIMNPELSSTVETETHHTSLSDEDRLASLTVEQIFTIPDARFIIPVPRLLPGLESVRCWKTAATILSEGWYKIKQTSGLADHLVPVSFSNEQPRAATPVQTLPDAGKVYDMEAYTPLLLLIGNGQGSNAEMYQHFLQTSVQDGLLASVAVDTDDVVQLSVTSDAALWITPGHFLGRLSDTVQYDDSALRTVMATDVLLVQIVGGKTASREPLERTVLLRHAMIIEIMSDIIKFCYKLQQIEPLYGVSTFVYKMNYLVADPEVTETVRIVEEFFGAFFIDQSSFHLLKTHILLRSLDGHPAQGDLKDFKQRDCITLLRIIRNSQKLSMEQELALKGYFIHDLLEPRGFSALETIEFILKLNATLVDRGGLLMQRWQDLPDILTDGLNRNTRTHGQLVALRDYPSIF